MKRSIICLIAFAVITAGFASAEVIYSNMIADHVDSFVQACIDSDGVEEILEHTAELREEFEKRESINELFFSRIVIEEFTGRISDLEAYCKGNNMMMVNQTLGRLKLCAQHIYNAGVF